MATATPDWRGSHFFRYQAEWRRAVTWTWSNTAGGVLALRGRAVTWTCSNTAGGVLALRGRAVTWTFSNTAGGVLAARGVVLMPR